MVNPVPITDNIHQTIGAVLIGYSLATFLFGINTVQLYIYLRSRGRDDSIYLKSLVVALWAVELGHQIAVAHATYDVLILNYGNLDVVHITPKGIDVAIIFSSFDGLIYQGYFTVRLWHASHSYLSTIILFILNGVRFASSFVLADGAFHMTSLSESLATKLWLYILVLGSSAAADILITVFLSSQLYSRRKTSMFKTAQLIDHLILWFIGTGLLTSIAAVLIIICLLSMRYNLVWLGIFILFPRLVSNSLMALFNSRKDMRKSLGGTAMVNIKEERKKKPFKPSRFGVHSEDSSPYDPGQSIAIEMTTEVVTDGDHGKSDFKSGNTTHANDSLIRSLGIGR